HPFSDPGATASDLCAGDVSAQIQVTGTVNVNVVGSYTLTYSASDGHGNISPSVSRTVNVVDTAPPVVSLVGGDVTVECHGTFSDPGATAFDLCAGNVSAQIQASGSVNVNLLGNYTRTYSVT